MLGKRAVVVISTAALAVSALPIASPAQAARGYSTTIVSGQTLRWNPCQRQITYKVNVRKVGNKRAQRKAVREVKLAFRKLARETGLPFVYRGKTRILPTGSNWHSKQRANAEIVVAYVRQNQRRFRSSLLSRGAWAMGGTIYKKWGQPQKAVIGKGFVVIDSAKTRRIRKGFGRGATRGNLVLHELGHVVGLNHAKNRRQLMYPILTNRTPAGYARGDRRGLRRVGARAGCISVPDYVFPSS